MPTQVGRLTVIGEAGRSASRDVLYRCTCACGNEAIVRAAQLRSGKTQSCGCLRRECSRESLHRILTEHQGRTLTGEYASPEYESWRGMRERCRHAKRRDWKHYGGRGIKVCDRWDGPEGFRNFLADMGKRPKGTTLDRINPDGDYEPSNCRWATWEVQRANRRG